MEAKEALDKVISKARVHFYKPIQIAEVLYHYRTDKNNLNPIEVNTYRTISKKWRDEVSFKLFGKKSISSSRFQDDVFNKTAMPPEKLEVLTRINNESDGAVEAYIYNKMHKKLDKIHEVGLYISSSNTQNFSLDHIIKIFDSSSGLSRSMDKIYEIITFALFSSIVKSLQAQVTLEILNKDKDILHDFRIFIKTVLGVDEENTRMISPASLYRVGATNAADAGLDMWANFGPAFQVKHLTLKPEEAGGIAEGLLVDRLVIICKDADKEAIDSLLRQLGLQVKVQGIITFSDLKNWYGLCMSEKYRDKLGAQLLLDLNKEFNNEFPSNEQIVPFLKEREYQSKKYPVGWE